MKLKLQPAEGVIILKTDEDKLKTIFCINDGYTVVFSYKKKDSKEIIKVPISFNEKDQILTIKDKQYKEDTVYELVNDENVDSYIFLEEDEIEFFEDMCKKFNKG